MGNSNEFIEPRITLKSMDVYVLRSGIFAAVKEASSILKGTLLDVGCGQMPYRDMILSQGKVSRYIGLDLQYNPVYRNRPDITWDGISIPLQENSADCALATEVLEHSPNPEKVFEEIFRILKPGGVFFFTVPFLWPLHNVPYDQYRFTPFALARHIENAGFEDFRLKPLGGWDKSLAQMIGLYVRRRPMSRLMKFLLSFMAFPLVFFLSRRRKMKHFFDGEKRIGRIFIENFMYTGICGIAYKTKVIK